MKKLLAVALLSAVFIGNTVWAQGDKSKRPSPPAKVTQTLASGATISIDYSQPSLKGRTIGKDIEPMNNKIWRMGANEATVFETDREVTIEGFTLPAGKYSLFGINSESGFTILFNKAWQIWGTQYNQNRDSDLMNITVKPRKLDTPQEQLTYTIDPSGKVSLLWGTMAIDFNVK